MKIAVGACCRRASVLVGALLVPTLVFAQAEGERSFESEPFGQRDLLCTQDTGTEIKDEKLISAPAGMFFLDARVVEVAPTKSYGGGNIGCLEWGPRQKTAMSARVNNRPMTVMVDTAIPVFAHADCTSGMGPVVSRWTITAYCKVVGTVAPLGR